MVDARYHTLRWQQLRDRVIKRDGGRCAYSNCISDMSKPNMIHVDHIVEVRDGGAFWDLTNLQTLCKPHHLVKTGTVEAGRITIQPRSPNGC